jgi:hypothetical protein
MMKQLKYLLLLCVWVGGGSDAQARKLDWSTGYFKLVAKTPTAKGTVSSFSTYQISLRLALVSRLEIGVGYTLNFSKFLSGDMGYGPDLGMFYFPFSGASAARINQGNIFWEQSEPVRPFVCAHFHQRQFQSIQASYAGFSAGAGLEYWMLPPFGLRVWVNSSRLMGPLQSTASETNLLIGASVEF